MGACYSNHTASGELIAVYRTAPSFAPAFMTRNLGLRPLQPRLAARTNGKATKRVSEEKQKFESQSPSIRTANEVAIYATGKRYAPSGYKRTGAAVVSQGE